MAALSITALAIFRRQYSGAPCLFITLLPDSSGLNQIRSMRNNPVNNIDNVNLCCVMTTLIQRLDNLATVYFKYFNRELFDIFFDWGFHQGTP